MVKKSPKKGKAAKNTPTERKPRTKKDKDAPKRSLSAFLFFSQEKRAGIVKEHPDYRVADVAKELGHMWGKLTPSQKKPFENMAAKDKERYEKAKAAYAKKA